MSKAEEYKVKLMDCEYKASHSETDAQRDRYQRLARLWAELERNVELRGKLKKEAQPQKT
jgi:hypothetical protein